MLSIGLILFVTIVDRMLVRPSWGPGEWSLAWMWDSTLWSNVVQIDVAWLLNIALFAPAGFFWSRLGHRIAPIVFGSIALSCLIEVLQGWFQLGISEPKDIVTNGFGAAIGALASRLTSRHGLSNTSPNTHISDSID